MRKTPAGLELSAPLQLTREEKDSKKYLQKPSKDKIWHEQSGILQKVITKLGIDLADE